MTGTPPLFSQQFDIFSQFQFPQWQFVFEELTLERPFLAALTKSFFFSGGFLDLSEKTETAHTVDGRNPAD